MRTGMSLWILVAMTGCVGGVEEGSRTDGLGNVIGDGDCGAGEEFCEDPAQAGEPGAGQDDDAVDEEGDEDEIDLPYDIKLPIGTVSRPIADAFAEKGVVPDEFTVDLDGAPWRADELTSNAAFEITQEDCDHAGNRDTGRDRVLVSWTGPEGTETDHLDIRYCED